MTENIELRYIGVCRSGPWDGQEVRAEMPVIRKGSGLPPGWQYFHENGVWYWEEIEE